MDWKAQKGRVKLWVRMEGEVPAWKVFEVSKEAAPSFTWARSEWSGEKAGEAQQSDEGGRRPTGSLLSDFEPSGVEALMEADDEWVENWWKVQQKMALEACLQDGEEAGALLEEEQCRPDARACGEWLQGDVEQEEGHEYVYGNDSWMVDRASVFIPGGICDEGMEEKWKKFGACDQVLGWIRQGGYRVQVSDEGKGIFLKNGRLAEEHNLELVDLVLQLVEKGSWEVVKEQQLVNVLPLHLAPKPGKTPPWRLICDGREVNEHIQAWKFRMESLKTLPMVVSEGDWLFTCDLEDAYYSAQLTEESRNLFGAKVSMKPEALKR